MRAQAKILAALYGICEDGVTKWDHKMEMPQVLDHVPVNYLARYYTPTTRCNQFVRDSDLWILIRDGEIAERNVAELTRVAGVVETIHVPVVLLLIVGGRHSSPSNTNISIGITSFAAAREALILFKDYSTGRLYLIGGKGEISPLKNEGSQDSIDLSSWNGYQNRQMKMLCQALWGTCHQSDKTSRDKISH